MPKISIKAWKFSPAIMKKITAGLSRFYFSRIWRQSIAALLLGLCLSALTALARQRQRNLGRQDLGLEHGDQLESKSGAEWRSHNSHIRNAPHSLKRQVVDVLRRGLYRRPPIQRTELCFQSKHIFAQYSGYYHRHWRRNLRFGQCTDFQCSRAVRT